MFAPRRYGGSVESVSPLEEDFHRKILISALFSHPRFFPRDSAAAGGGGGGGARAGLAPPPGPDSLCLPSSPVPSLEARARRADRAGASAGLGSEEE